MKEQLSIQINGTNHPIEFSHETSKILFKMWGVDSYSGIDRKLEVSFKNQKINEMSFDTFDVIAEITLAGVKTYNTKSTVTIDEISDLIYFTWNKEQVIEITEAFVTSLPPIDSYGKKKNYTSQTFYNLKEYMC